jgi:hypothetical protein
MRTIAWSPRVGEVWTRSGYPDVEVVAEHTTARLVKLKVSGGESHWIPATELEGDYSQACCGECGVPLTAMRKLLVEEAERNSPAPSPAPKPARSSKGSYCQQPCCWPPHAPRSC